MTSDALHCDVTEGCITCGDIAVPLTVVEILGADASGFAGKDASGSAGKDASGSAGKDALCRDDEGRSEMVALDFVTAGPGDRVLVHAGVALELLQPADPKEG